MNPTYDILTGRTDAHVGQVGFGAQRLHSKVLVPLARLQKLAAKDGLDLEVVSAFRGFDQQLRIWNEKAEGKRPLLDKGGKPLEFADLGPDEIVTAILRWSALPGASRHHWGTDFDVVAKNLVPDGYKVQLVPAEIQPGGVFQKLGKWLDDRLPIGGFYRPYATERGGVSPEWWHLSYAPIAEPYRKAFTLDLFRRSVASTNLLLKANVEARLDEIYETYVDNVEDPDGG